MKIKKVVIPAITLVILISCLVGIPMLNRDETTDFIQESPDIIVEVVEPTESPSIPIDFYEQAIDIIDKHKETEIVDVLEETEEGTIIGTTQSGDIAEIILPDIPEDTGIPEYGTPEYEAWSEERRAELSAQLDEIFGLGGESEEPTENLPVEDNKPTEPEVSDPIETPDPTPSQQPAQTTPPDQDPSPSKNPEPTPSQSHNNGSKDPYSDNYVSDCGLTDEELRQLTFEETHTLSYADFARWTWIMNQYGSVGEDVNSDVDFN